MRLSIKSPALLLFKREDTFPFPYGAAEGRTKASRVNRVPLNRDLQGGAAVVCADLTFYKVPTLRETSVMEAEASAHNFPLTGGNN